MEMKIYHVTTPKKAKLYNYTWYIVPPIRWFDTLQWAMAWAIKTGRTVIYEVECSKNVWKLPDHHNIWGNAYWCEDKEISRKCIYSADNDA